MSHQNPFQEHLLNYKNWCIVLCTFMSIPLCLFCWAVNLNLAWTYYFTGILIACTVVPISLSILWARATAAGTVQSLPQWMTVLIVLALHSLFCVQERLKGHS